jgi:hypothetical protein
VRRNIDKTIVPTTIQIVFALLFRHFCKRIRYLFLSHSNQLIFFIIVTSFVNITVARVGTMVKAMTSDTRREKVTVRANPLTKIEVIPLLKTIGKNTAIVVNVEADMASATSRVPFTAAVNLSSPFSMCR